MLHSLGLKLEIKIIAVQKKWQRIPINPHFPAYAASRKTHIDMHVTASILSQKSEMPE
jgi:hypothetical protein